MSRLARITVVVGLAALLCADTALASRRRVEEVEAKPTVSFLPSAAAPQALDAPVLSGLDYTAIAPPGTRIRVIEDEPYVLMRGHDKKGLKQDDGGFTRLTLVSHHEAGGWYEATISLRYNPQKSDDNPLLLSFDTAAHYTYRRALLEPEERGETAYSLYEVRSPLGLTDPRDKENRWREYLAYSTAVANPALVNPASAPTPYQFIQGELRVLRRVEARYFLLAITFESHDFAQALTLTENIARCVVNRLEPDADPVYKLDYLAYYPEFEAPVPYYEGELIDERTGDLAERPGEGCGTGATPITGDVCPLCGGDGPFWPARPYADPEYLEQLEIDGELPVCSHCLMHLMLPEEELVELEGLEVDCAPRKCPDPCADPCEEFRRSKSS